MRRLALTLALAVLAAACSPDRAVEAPSGEDVRETPAPLAGTEDNIGDVEQEIRLTARLAPESQADNIEEDVREDARQHVNYVVISVRPPYPDELFIRFSAESERLWKEAPAVIRCDAIISDERAGEDYERDLFAAVFGSGAINKTVEKTIDVLEPLDEVPSTLLVRTSCLSMLMPKGTPEGEVNPETVRESEAQGTSMANRANPVRINFLPEPVETGRSADDEEGEPGQATGADDDASAETAGEEAPAPAEPAAEDAQQEAVPDGPSGRPAD
jgi:hypothetical protein